MTGDLFVFQVVESEDVMGGTGESLLVWNKIID